MKEFKQLVTEAKERFSNDPEMMGVLEEMESDVSLQSRETKILMAVLENIEPDISLKSRVTGTLLALFLCGEVKDGE